MKMPKSELSLKKQIKAKKVWDSKIMNTPSLKYPTKILVWDSKILSAPSLKYPKKFYFGIKKSSASRR